MSGYFSEDIARVRDYITKRLYAPYDQNVLDNARIFFQREDHALIIQVLLSLGMSYGSPGIVDDPHMDTIAWWDIINDIAYIVDDAPDIYEACLPFLGNILSKNMKTPDGVSAGDYILDGFLKYGVKSHSYLIPGIIEVLSHESSPFIREEAWQLIQSFDESQITPYIMVFRNIHDCPI